VANSLIGEETLGIKGISGGEKRWGGRSGLWRFTVQSALHDQVHHCTYMYVTTRSTTAHTCM
jgi:hypothetical protein